MTMDDVRVGRYYTAKVNGLLVPVRVDRVWPRVTKSGRRTLQVEAMSLVTGRYTRMGYRRLRNEVPREQAILMAERLIAWDSARRHCQTVRHIAQVLGVEESEVRQAMRDLAVVGVLAR